MGANLLPTILPTIGPLGKDLPELVIILIFVNVMYSDVSIIVRILVYPAREMYLPLKCIRPGILVISFGTEWAHISRGIMHESMTDHLVFPLEPLPSLSATATWDGTVVWSCLTMHICVGTELSKSKRTAQPTNDNLSQKVLGLKRGRIATWKVALEAGARSCRCFQEIFHLFTPKGSGRIDSMFFGVVGVFVFLECRSRRERHPAE